MDGRDGVSLLLVEDSASEARRVCEVLSGLNDPPVRVELASTVAGALGALRKRSFDIVMLDLGLPDGRGLAGLRRVRVAAAASAVIVRANQRDERLACDAVAAGAHDYLIKETATAPEPVGRSIRVALNRQRAEQAALELLGAVVDSAPTGLAIVEIPGQRPTRVNQMLCRILGYEEEQLLAAELLQISHPEDRPRLEAAARRLLTGELEAYQTEVRCFHHDGHVIWAEISASVLRADGGGPRYFVVQISDISDRKRVERALQQERDHTAAILAAIGEGYALSVDGRITEVNDALCTLTGYSRDELVGAGQPWPFWSWPSGLWSPDLSGAPPEGEIAAQMTRRDGSRFEAEVNARAAHNPDGSVLGWVIAIRDVSDRRRYEAEMERLATHDPLTGLANHRVFHQRLSEEVAMARRYDRPLGLAILDLDHFKQINDAYGHLVGDHALVAVAERLAGMVREGELLARVGGEEFAWILPEADEEDAEIAAERGRIAVSGSELSPVGTITISVGVACLATELDASGLYHRADLALLGAKRDGRDRTVRWGESGVVG